MEGKIQFKQQHWMRYYFQAFDQKIKGVVYCIGPLYHVCTHLVYPHRNDMRKSKLVQKGCNESTQH